MTRLVVIGGGSLSTATLYSLATLDLLDAQNPARIQGSAPQVESFVLTRQEGAAESICTIANIRGASTRHVRFHPISGASADIEHPDFATLVHQIRPTGILLCASRQSPWEGDRRPSAWTSFVRRAGFGVTLPLQADYAILVGRIAEASGAWFVNACLPDLVDPLLRALGIPVTTGVGNLAILAAALQEALGLPDQSSLTAVGHHLHLHPPACPDDELRAWQDGKPVEHLELLLAPVRRVQRTELNHLTGHTIARTVGALLTGARLDCHLAGPDGLPGGYPARLENGRVGLRLPPDLDLDDARALNERWSLEDGALASDGHVIFGPAAAEALAAELPHLSDGFEIAELARARDDLMQLRERLRHRPEGESGGGT